ncbi:MAG: helix-turn-helix domain-containing protein [Caldilineales bacterium]|nr:helix-turn-helix domain-containing protein [Caldilineales bacterium]MDW8318693.1 helix-turn-helix domain-containing protein [Anaerolineae bacterium]
MQPDTTSSSIARALLLLEALLEQPQGVDIPDLLERLDVARSSLFALLNTLKALGYVEQAERRGRYRAGPRLLAWRGPASPSAHLQTAFYAEAAALALAETLALALPAGAGGEAVLAAQVEGSSQVRSVFPLGLRFPPQSATAQVLTASPSDAVRRDGYAVATMDESVDLAVPVCADGQTPSAALVLSVPAFRWSQQRLAGHLSLLRETAARLSYRLGALRYAPWRAATEDQPSPRQPLEPAAMAAFLAAPWLARLACVRPDGAPHVVPVWQEWDGQCFFVAAWQGSLWAQYVLANPNVSLTVDEPWPPLRRVFARGRALPLQPGDYPGGLNALLNRLRRRYLGPGGVLPAGEWQAFRVQTESLSAWQGLS